MASSNNKEVFTEIPNIICLKKNEECSSSIQRAQTANSEDFVHESFLYDKNKRDEKLDSPNSENTRKPCDLALKRNEEVNEEPSEYTKSDLTIQQCDEDSKTQQIANQTKKDIACAQSNDTTTLSCVTTTPSYDTTKQYFKEENNNIVFTAIDNNVLSNQTTYMKPEHQQKLFKNVLPFSSRGDEAKPYNPSSKENNVSGMTKNSTQKPELPHKLFKNVLPCSGDESKLYKTISEEKNLQEFCKEQKSPNTLETNCKSNVIQSSRGEDFIQRGCSSQERNGKTRSNQGQSQKMFKKIQYGAVNRHSWAFPTVSPQEKGVGRASGEEKEVFAEEELKTTDPLFPEPTRPRSKSTAEDEVRTFLTQIGYYENITRRKFKYLQNRCTEDQMLRDFRGEEVCARIIFHFIYNGWRPNSKSPTLDWHRNKLPSQFSVTELYLFLMHRQQRVLASYLKTYRVDGHLMGYILQDNILQSQLLPDRSYISEVDFQKLRSDFYGVLV